MKSIYFLFAVMLAVQQLPAQTADDIHGSAVKDRDITNAPLFLSINGEGRVFPFHDGQMLRVGREYTMIAVPDRGYVFSNWTVIVVFTDTEYAYDINGNALPPIVSVIPSPAVYTTDPVLKFTVQPVNVILDDPNVIEITERIEWQANFVPERRPGHDRGWWRRWN